MSSQNGASAPTIGLDGESTVTPTVVGYDYTSATNGTVGAGASVPQQGTPGTERTAKQARRAGEAEATGVGPEPARQTEADPKDEKKKLTAVERLWRVAAIALAAVIVAPTALSGAHLIKWAGEDVAGLDLPSWLVWLPLVALDGTAIVGITMVTIAALRGEHGGAFHLVSWSIALISAGINYGYGTSTPAEWDEWFFPIMSLTGPALLEITLAFARRWKRIDEGLRFQGVKIGDFGKRWMPSVATRETWAAWKVAQREGIRNVDDAIVRVREVELLRSMGGADALRLAFDQIGSRGVFEARLWLLGRGIRVTEDQVRLALKPRDLLDVVANGENSEGLTASEVAAAWIGKDASAADVERVRRELDAAVGDGRIVSEGKGARGKAVRYRSAGAAA